MNRTRTMLTGKTKRKTRPKKTHKTAAPNPPKHTRAKHTHAPVADVGEGLLVGDVVHQQNTHGATIVGGGDGAEPLLACRVPNLQLATLVVDFDSANLEVNADGGDEGSVERVVGKTEQQAALAHA